jgi:hypothetical protein
MKSATIAMAALAAMVVGTALSASTAKADVYWGPLRNGNQCFTYSELGLHNETGYWAPCPAPAAAVVTHHVRHHAKRI